MNDQRKELIKRKSCRGLFVTSDRKILLMEVGNSDADWIGWITPGGGMKEGESEEETLRREIKEELGVTGFLIEGPVWKRFHQFKWKSSLIAQEEVFFLIQSDEFIPQSTMDMEESELLDFKRFKWWHLNEIKDSNLNFAPNNLYQELKDLLLCGIPTKPTDVGI